MLPGSLGFAPAVHELDACCASALAGAHAVQKPTACLWGHRAVTLDTAGRVFELTNHRRHVLPISALDIVQALGIDATDKANVLTFDRRA